MFVRAKICGARNVWMGIVDFVRIESCSENVGALLIYARGLSVVISVEMRIFGLTNA